MAEKTSGFVEIAAPVSAVAGVIADLANYPKWTGGMSAPEVFASDEQGRPLEAAFAVSSGPISDRVRLKYHWRESSVHWQLIEAQSLTLLDGEYRWEPTESGTLVHYELALDLKSSLPSFMRKLAEKAIITSALQGLKKQVEGSC